MAARDPVLEELRRNAAGEQEKKSNLVASTTYSTTSLEAVTNEDIGKCTILHVRNCTGIR